MPTNTKTGISTKLFKVEILSTKNKAAFLTVAGLSPSSVSLRLYSCLFATNAGPGIKYLCSSEKEISFEMSVFTKFEVVPLRSPTSSKYPWAF